MSRQALIFSRRHTQHKGSPGPPEVSAPQTEHLPGFFSRSVTIDSLACSRISGAITGSDLSGIFRFIAVPRLKYNITRQLLRAARSKVLAGLGSFGQLHYHSHIQRRSATRTSLSRRYPRTLPDNIDRRRNRMGANRTMHLASDAFLNECFHLCFLPSQHRTQKPEHELCQFL
jgi:hypothetical protein